MNNVKTCEGCRFWRFQAGYQVGERMVNIGQCRRHAPEAGRREGGGVHPVRSWPETRAEECCGDWQAKPEPPPSTPEEIARYEEMVRETTDAMRKRFGLK